MPKIHRKIVMIFSYEKDHRQDGLFRCIILWKGD